MAQTEGKLSILKAVLKHRRFYFTLFFFIALGIFTCFVPGSAFLGAIYIATAVGLLVRDILTILFTHPFLPLLSKIIDVKKVNALLEEDDYRHIPKSPLWSRMLLRNTDSENQVDFKEIIMWPRSKVAFLKYYKKVSETKGKLSVWYLVSQRWFFYLAAFFLYFLGIFAFEYQYLEIALSGLGLAIFLRDFMMLISIRRRLPLVAYIIDLKTIDEFLEAYTINPTIEVNEKC